VTRPPKRQRPGMPPTSVRVIVALRQLEAFGASDALTTRSDGEKVDAFLERLLCGLSLYIGCERVDLRLDHEPMLRRRAYDPTIEKVADRYEPHAHDPGCLLYRPQLPEFAGSHHVKTFIRGEHGQFSDAVLAKRERRRERPKTASHKPKMKSRGFQKGKRKIPSRPFRRKR